MARLLTKILPQFYHLFMTCLSILGILALVINEQFEGHYTRPERIREAETGMGALMSTQRAFVIQFRPEADVAQGQWAGRVEHVGSGQATHFSSLEELLSFVTRLLAQSSRPAGFPEEGEEAS